MLEARSGSYGLIVSIITLGVFLFTTFSQDIAWAAKGPMELASLGSKGAAGAGSFKELNVETFSIPAYLGHIKDSWQPASSTLRRGQRANNSLAQGESLPSVVIHIQDAHCNYYAQHRISEIIGYLNANYGISTINLEGGAKGYDLGLFTDISDKSIREKAADYFVKEGMVNGSEYYAINNPDKVSLWGIEDTGLYLENLKVYRDSLEHKEDIDKHLKSLSDVLNNLKTKIYSKELFEFDLKYSAYKAEKIEFKDYLNYLIAKAKEKIMDVKSFNNIHILTQTLDEEAGIDFKKANREREALMDAVQKKLSRNALSELVAKAVEFKQERISQKDFYAYLADKAKKQDVELANYPELQKYILYVSRYEAIDKTKVMEEIDALEDKIKETLYKNDKDRKLADLSKTLALTKNIFNISISMDDYRFYKAHESDFESTNYAKFIEKEAPLYGITTRPESGIEKLDGYREDISKFYECSFKRDKAFVKNLRFNSLKRTTNDEQRTTIIVTGGFHTENLAELFKKNNIAYISIMPNFKNGNGYECPYFKILSGNKYINIATTLSSVLKNALANWAQLCPTMKRAIEAGDGGPILGPGPGMVASVGQAAQPAMPQTPLTAGQAPAAGHIKPLIRDVNGKSIKYGKFNRDTGTMIESIDRRPGAFTGGGPAAIIAHTGALLELQNHHFEFSEVAGTSAGAIIACLVSAGFTADEISDMVLDPDMDFEQFKDRRWGFVTPFINLLVFGGLYRGNKLKDWLDEKLKAKLKIDHPPTFKELEERGIPLFVVVSDISNTFIPKRVVFNAKDHPDMPVSEAVQMSVRVPLLFEPRRWAGTYNNEQVKIDSLDGSLLDNYPIDVFELNSEPIGFLIKGSESSGSHSVTMLPPIIKVLLALIVTGINAIERKNIADEYWERTVQIQLPVLTKTERTFMRFTFSKQEKEELINAGRKGVRDLYPKAIMGTKGLHGPTIPAAPQAAPAEGPASLFGMSKGAALGFSSWAEEILFRMPAYISALYLGNTAGSLIFAALAVGFIILHAINIPKLKARYAQESRAPPTGRDIFFGVFFAPIIVVLITALLTPALLTLFTALPSLTTLISQNMQTAILLTVSSSLVHLGVNIAAFRMNILPASVGHKKAQMAENKPKTPAAPAAPREAFTEKDLLGLLSLYLGGESSDRRKSGEDKAAKILDELKRAGVAERFYGLFKDPYMSNWYRSFTRFYELESSANIKKMDPKDLLVKFIRSLGQATIYRADAVPNEKVTEFERRVETNGFQSKFRTKRMDDARKKEVEMFRKYGTSELMQKSFEREPLTDFENGKDGEKRFFISVSVASNEGSAKDIRRANERAEAYARGVAATFTRARICESHAGHEGSVNKWYRDYTIVIHKAIVDRYYMIRQAGAELDTEIDPKEKSPRSEVVVQTNDGRYEEVDMNNDSNLEAMLTEIPAKNIIERTTYPLNCGIGWYEDIENCTKYIKNLDADSLWYGFQEKLKNWREVLAVDDGYEAERKARMTLRDIMREKMGAKFSEERDHYDTLFHITHVAKKDRNMSDPDARIIDVVCSVVEDMVRKRVAMRGDVNLIHGIDPGSKKMLPGFDELPKNPERESPEERRPLPDEYYKARFRQFSGPVVSNERPSLEKIGQALYKHHPQSGNIDLMKPLSDLEELKKEADARTYYRDLAKDKYDWLTDAELDKIAAMFYIKWSNRGDWSVGCKVNMRALLRNEGLYEGVRVKMKSFNENDPKKPEGIYEMTGFEDYRSGLVQSVKWKFITGGDLMPPCDPSDIIKAINAADIIILPAPAAPAEIDTLASRIHAMWMRTWAKYHPGQQKLKDKDAVDIANTNYYGLPEVWKKENRAAAENGMTLLARANEEEIESDKLLSTLNSVLVRLYQKKESIDEEFGKEDKLLAFVFKAGEFIHKEWQHRRMSERATDYVGELPRKESSPFAKLTPEEQEYDFNVLKTALEYTLNRADALASAPADFPTEANYQRGEWSEYFYRQGVRTSEKYKGDSEKAAKELVDAAKERHVDIVVIDFNTGKQDLGQNIKTDDIGSYRGHVYDEEGCVVFTIDHHFDAEALDDWSATRLTVEWIRRLQAQADDPTNAERKSAEETLVRLKNSYAIVNHQDCDMLLAQYLVRNADRRDILNNWGDTFTATALWQDHSKAPGAKLRPKAEVLMRVINGITVESETKPKPLFENIIKDLMPKALEFVEDRTLHPEMAAYYEAGQAQYADARNKLRDIFEKMKREQPQQGNVLVVNTGEYKIYAGDVIDFMNDNCPELLKDKQVLLLTCLRPDGKHRDFRIRSIRQDGRANLNLMPLYDDPSKLLPDAHLVFHGRRLAGGGTGLDKEINIDAVRQKIQEYIGRVSTAPAAPPAEGQAPAVPLAVKPPPAANTEIERLKDVLAKSTKGDQVDRVEMVRLMGEWVIPLLRDNQDQAGTIRRILTAIDVFPAKEKAELESALRAVLEINGLGDITPAQLNIVVQFARIGQRNMPQNQTGNARRELNKPGGKYNELMSQSIIGEGVDSVGEMRDVIRQALKAIGSAKDPRALFYLPTQRLKKLFMKAAIQLNIAEKVNGEFTMKDARIRIQLIDQGNSPDAMTQFILGVELLEFVRRCELDKAELDSPNQSLVNLLAAVADGQDPKIILQNLFERKFYWLKARKIDWDKEDDKRRAWEAVVKSL
jgi:NTE family protein